MNYDSYKEWAICTCNGIIDDCNRMTSGNYMHNINAVKLMAKIIRDNCLPHLFENPQSQWISVEDKLPDDGVLVLVAYRWILGEILYASDTYHIDYGWEDYEDIIAWMPIPELPKEEKK